MINDISGKIVIQFRDVNNNVINGDFDDIPKNAIIANVFYEYYSISRFSNKSYLQGSYKVIIGHPIYETDTCVTSDDFCEEIKNEQPMLVVGTVMDTDYYIVPRSQDIVVSNMNDFINVIQEIGVNFLENLDKIDSNLRKLKK